MKAAQQTRRNDKCLGMAVLLCIPVILTACNTQTGGLLDPTQGGGTTTTTGGTTTNPGGTTPTTPVTLFDAGSFIFSTKNDPIDGFTYTHSGASMEYWVLRPPMSVPRTFLGGCALNDRLYAVGGVNVTGDVATVEVLDLPGTQVWSAVAPLSSPRSEVSAAAANGRVYAMGGFHVGTGLLTNNDEYNPDTNTWTPRAPVPFLRSMGAAVTVNDKIYLIGGTTLANNVYTQISSVNEYDPATDTWTAKAPMHYARQEVCATVLNGHIFAIGGAGDIGADSAVEEYDPSTNVWTVRTPITHARRSAGAFGWNNKVYVVGGIEGAGLIKETEEYDPQFNAWSPRADMITLHYGFGYANIGPSCYSFGGNLPNGQWAQDCHEYFAYTLVYPFRKN